MQACAKSVELLTVLDNLLLLEWSQEGIYSVLPILSANKLTVADK